MLDLCNAPEKVGVVLLILYTVDNNSLVDTPENGEGVYMAT